MQRWIIDYDYLKTLGIKIIKGRNFSPDFRTDSTSIILNETAVKKLGLDATGSGRNNPIQTLGIGQKIYTWVQGGRLVSYDVIGVVKDFHFESLRQDIGPLCFVLGSEGSLRSQTKSTGLISFKINSANIPDIINQAEAIWKNMASGMPFSYRFLDESFDEVYKAERRVGVIALSFSLLAIIVACLGLFGLSTFLAEQKTKEIGVRKVLGASIPSIILMLSKEFIKWIIVANIIAFPVAYYFMNKWLQDFAYRINIDWWLFVISGCIALVIALLTISFQAIKAAAANPVESLRYE